VRDHLRDRSVDFEDRNIRQDESARRQLLDLRGDLVVPLLIVGDHHVVGYDPDAIDEALAHRGEALS
jgi:glutaredoxin